MNATTRERFEKYVDRSGDCWLWTGAKNRSGYGQLNVGKHVPRLAHRLALWLVGRDVPPGHFVHHTCEVKACVNPDHLEVLATQREHSDRHAKRTCQKHGAEHMTIVRSGKTIGVYYCAACNRENRRRWRAARRKERARAASGADPASAPSVPVLSRTGTYRGTR